MKLSLLTMLCLTLGAVAVEPSKDSPMIFHDDFLGPRLNPAWRILWPDATVTEGVLSISQATARHSAVALVPVGHRDVTVAFRFKLGGADSINAVFNDRDFKEGHGGHICRVSLSPRQIFLADDKERLRREIEEMKKDPARKAEADKLVAGRSKGFAVPLDPTRWYALEIGVVGDVLRVSLDDRVVGSLQSSGIAHPVKSDFYFAVSGKDALFDDLHIWKPVNGGQ